MSHCGISTPTKIILYQFKFLTGEIMSHWVYFYKPRETNEFSDTILTQVFEWNCYFKFFVDKKKRMLSTGCSVAL